MTSLIDSGGRLWDSTDSALARSLRTRLSGDALASYAVMNLGFVSLAPRERFLRVACRPSIMAPPASIALLHYVNDRTTTIGFDYFTERWNHIVIANRTKFRNLLFSMTCAEPQDRDQEALMRRSVDGQSSPHRTKVAAVRRIFGNASSSSEVATPLDKLFGGRWCLNELNNETGHSVVRDIGQSYTPLNPAWLATAVGNSLCDYADEAYGGWVADHYRAALRGAEPFFDEVDAVVHFPSIGPARLCYARLTLPVSLRQERLVLSAAVSDSGINLRSPRFDEAG